MEDEHVHGNPRKNYLLIKTAALLLVLALYAVIYLKILVLN